MKLKFFINQKKIYCKKFIPIFLKKLNYCMFFNISFLIFFNFRSVPYTNSQLKYTTLFYLTNFQFYAKTSTNSFPLLLWLDKGFVLIFNKLGFEKSLIISLFYWITTQLVQFRFYNHIIVILTKIEKFSDLFPAVPNFYCSALFVPGTLSRTSF